MDDIAKQARRQAVAQEAAGNLEAAVAAWGKVQERAPGDPEATRRLVELVIARSRQRQGLLNATDTHRFAPQDAPRFDAQGLPAIKYQDERLLNEVLALAMSNKRTPIQQLELAVRDYPANPDLYLKLASLYMEKDRDYDAERILAKGKESTDDPRVAEYWEEVAMVRHDRKVELAAKHHASDPSKETEQALADARKMRDRFQTDVFLNRCQREPENAALRYQLGLRHKQAGKMRDAYECFVQALPDPRQHALAAFEMAECLVQGGKLVEALQYYREAANSATWSQAECKKQALFSSATLAAKMRLFPLALRYLKALADVDPLYPEAQDLRDEIERQTTGSIML
jgi:tetratricopeptide (TPR) repeat protein